MRITVDYSSGHDLTHVPDEILEQCFHSDAVLVSAWSSRRQVGTMAYRHDPERGETELIWLFVDPAYRRQGAGRAMIDWLWNHRVLWCLVPDTELALHLFLKAQHFKARSRGDKYLFRRKV